MSFFLLCVGSASCFFFLLYEHHKAVLKRALQALLLTLLAYKFQSQRPKLQTTLFFSVSLFFFYKVLPFICDCLLPFLFYSTHAKKEL